MKAENKLPKASMNSISDSEIEEIFTKLGLKWKKGNKTTGCCVITSNKQSQESMKKKKSKN